jgi:hypothetical protein
MLHDSTFEYLAPTAAQLEAMKNVRAKFTEFAKFLDLSLPDGPDKTFVLRQLRDCAMWSNQTLTRTADGTPRT